MAICLVIGRSGFYHHSIEAEVCDHVVESANCSFPIMNILDVISRLRMLDRRYLIERVTQPQVELNCFAQAED